MVIIIKILIALFVGCLAAAILRIYTHYVIGVQYQKAVKKIIKEKSSPLMFYFKAKEEMTRFEILKKVINTDNVYKIFLKIAMIIAACIFAIVDIKALIFLFF